MDFDTLVLQITELLQRQGRVSYGALKRRFNLDDDYVQDLKDELIGAQRIAVDEDGKILVWKGSLASSVQSPESKSQEPVSTVPTLAPKLSDSRLDTAERRQLTVMFCDLVGSTALSAHLDPEDYRTVVQRYQQTCAQVIQRYEGYLAQYLGDGVLVYFGYPIAHEDDARRAVRTGLEIITAIGKRVPSPLAGEPVLSPVEGGQGEGVKEKPLQVRLGIHTGLVVIGDIGASGRVEHLALGETPNVAARIQGLADPNTVLISAATQRLVEGQFECQPFGSHQLRGIDTPIALYHVQSERQSAAPLSGRTTLTPLVGREQEVGLLLDRWEQAKEGRGQVVLLSGEPGIGKSRLAYTLREHVTNDVSLLFEARCSPYHQHSAFYPLIEVLQRTLVFTRQDTDEEKVQKLDRVLALYNMQEAVPLFTALLSLPTPAQYPPLNVTPQKQKERTLHAVAQLLVVQAERQATVSVWEDLHWADPSSLEFLSLLIEQIPTSKLLLVLTFRPEFTPPWKPRSHISQLVLNRLGQKHVETMIAKVAESKGLSAEVIEQIRLKTDGVPLFVEELTKSVVEARGQVTGDEGQNGKTIGMLGIPATLQEALLARLDRLSSARQIAQLGATLGREFSYELLQAVTPISEIDLHGALEKLVEAEILYQRGVGEQARYVFKHALIQDTAYQSLLKSTRQHYHQQIAQVLEEQFPQTKETQPELLAHHYTEAGLIAQALPYWQQAGQRAVTRSANAEAIRHFTTGVELISSLPNAIERAQQELMLQVALIGPLTGAKGWGAPELEPIYTRARELCQQVGETPQLFPVLLALQALYLTRGEPTTAYELGVQCLRVAQRAQDSELLLAAYGILGWDLLFLGDLVSARTHVEQSIALYDAQQHRALAFRYGQDLGAAGLSCLAYILWRLGYPDRALISVTHARTLAQDLGHPYSIAMTLYHSSSIHRLRREEYPCREYAEACMSLSTKQGFPQFLAWSILERNWALSEQGQERAIIPQMRQVLTNLQTSGVKGMVSLDLALLAEVQGKAGQAEEGLALMAEALELLNQTDERWYGAELYRLKGELTLQKFRVSGFEFQVSSSPQPLTPSTHAEAEAEACFLKAIDIARQQQAKSWELRAVMSLVRLRQQQAVEPASRNTQYEARLRLDEVQTMLSEVYHWFTEGFDTKDLQEAKALLEELSDRAIESVKD